MKEFQMLLRDVAQNGQTFQYNNQNIWLEPLKEFHISCKIVDDIQAEVFILPEEDGCLLRGKLRGKVSVPCDRCAEETEIVIDYSFDEFEAYPQDDLEVNAEDLLEDDRVLFKEKNALILDMGALLWEEFVLTLPTKPLCRKDCKGVCPVCGKNLNEGACTCEKDGNDPRMAVLRNLKIQ